MKFNSEIHKRRSVRLKGHDYSQAGAYVVTICTWQRECLFGEILNGEMILNRYGYIVKTELLRTQAIRHEIEIDEFIIMPNHLHGIVIINNTDNTGHCNVGANGRSPLRMKARSISSFISGFKSSVTTTINRTRNTPGHPVWQRNYYEHIVRNTKDMYKMRQYIKNNPMQWEIDKNNPKNF